MLRLAFAALFLLAVGAGCASVQDLTQTQPVTAETLALVRDSLRAGAPGAARRAAAVRRLAAAGVTPFADGTFDGGRPPNRDGLYQLDGGPGGAEVVGGFVPGRHPLGRSRLVVLGASSDETSASAVLEASRVLVARSLVENVPDQTVLVTLWDGRASNEAGVASALALPVWPRTAVTSVVVVGATDGVVDGVPVRGIRSDGDPVALVEQIVASVVEAAAYVPPVYADSTQ